MRTSILSLAKRTIYLFLANGFRINSRIKHIYNQNLVVILNLHRVCDFDGSAYEPLNPKVFYELLQFCNKHFHITTFAEINQISNIKKPKLILSFDDGYKDFIDVAVPILSKLNIKVNQNIIPICVESGLPPLNVMLQDFVGKSPLELVRKLDIPEFSMPENIQNRVQVGMKASLSLKNRPIAEQNKLREYIMPQLMNFNELNFTQMMNQADILELIDIHEFGAHSFEHANIGLESDEYFVNDLINCKKYFKDKFSKLVNIYAFPNGNYRDGQLQVAQNHGFEHLLLVSDDFSKPDNKFHKRFTFYADSIYDSRVRATGNLVKL